MASLLSDAFSLHVYRANRKGLSPGVFIPIEGWLCHGGETGYSGCCIMFMSLGWFEVKSVLLHTD